MRRSEPPVSGRHLVIVHNTDSGPLRAAAAAWRRLTRPHAALCALCGLTRGVRGTNPRWQGYLDTLDEPVRSMNRDTWRADHASSSWRTINLPAILLQDGDSIVRLVNAEEIRRCESVPGLIQVLDTALAANPPAA